MSSNLSKPENALKRAEELILVGQSSLAFQNLHDLIMSKKLRSNQANYENIMIRYVNLAVNMRKGKHAKEALTQYRNQTLFTNLNSFETVMGRFIEVAESKVPLEYIATFEVEDLDTPEAPECFLERILNGEDDVCTPPSAKLDIDDLSLTLSLRFLWEAYRITLDIIRNSPKLEAFYYEIALKAFQFCEKYHRTVEFRRLCEVLRSHLSQIIKGPTLSSQYSGISLTNTDSMTTQLQIRFAQLNSALSLEVWPEAFRSVEDIFELLSMTKKGTVSHHLMINYYEALTKIFRVSGNSLFLAAAWNKYLSFLTCQPENLTAATLEDITTCTFLAALSVPLHVHPFPFSEVVGDISLDYQDSQLSKDSKITSMLGLSKPPTRDQLIADVCVPSYWNLVDPNVHQLFEALSYLPNAQETPKTLSEKFSAILSRLTTHPSYSQFIPLLQKVVFSLLMKKIIFSMANISFSELLKITSNIFLSQFSLFDLELLALQEASHYSDSYKFLIDDRTCSFYIRPVPSINELLPFYPLSLDASLPTFHSENNDDDVVIEESIESHFVNLKRIEEQISSISRSRFSIVSADSVKDLVILMGQINAAINDEYCQIALKKEQFLLTKEQKEARFRELELTEAVETASRLSAEQEQLRIHRTEQFEALEKERKKEEMMNIQLSEKRKLIDQVIQKINAYGQSIDPESLLNLSREEILHKQAEFLALGKHESERKLNAITKRMDHLERALRLEERPLLLEEHKAHLVANQQTHQMHIEKLRHTESVKHALQVAAIKSARSRLAAASVYFDQFKEAKWDQLKPTMIRMKKEFNEVKESLIAQATEAFLKRRAEEETLLKKQQEQEEFLAKKKLVEEEEKKQRLALDEEATQKLKRQEEIQRKREAEIEAKLDKQKYPSSSKGSFSSKSKYGSTFSFERK